MYLRRRRRRQAARPAAAACATRSRTVAGHWMEHKQTTKCNRAMMQPITILRNALSIQSTLKAYHPLLIEGHSRDDRDPRAVGDQVGATRSQVALAADELGPPALTTCRYTEDNLQLT